MSELFNPQSLDAYADPVYSQNSNAPILLFKPLTQEEISSLDPAILQAIWENSTSLPEPSDILGILVPATQRTSGFRLTMVRERMTLRL